MPKKWKLKAAAKKVQPPVPAPVTKAPVGAMSTTNTPGLTPPPKG